MKKTIAVKFPAEMQSFFDGIRKNRIKKILPSTNTAIAIDAVKNLFAQECKK